MPTVHHLQYGAINVADTVERNAAFDLNHCFASPAGGYDSERIAEHFNTVCCTSVGNSYAFAYARWKRTLAKLGATCFEANVDIRLLIGMAQPSLWDTNLYLNPVYGTPWIPGSSTKGGLRHYIERYLIADAHDADAIAQGFLSPQAFTALFGAASGTDAGAGLVVLHDAWWVPGSAPAAAGRHKGQQHPLVREVVTPHHPGFLDTQGEIEATPFDSPRPVPQLAAHGRFLFAVAPRLKAYRAWAPYAAEYLKLALQYEGIGARTPEYGKMQPI